ncbi:flavodoxin domain-containing protein [Candidatus Enterococcus murrayae]|uniref:Flavodoxin domain-containing protein n=1 Tax=Candidatus Enterococcus murrayae TaxID=2815321 RepID=A0ABS3HBI6_9ENTE|nr:flavodoxin domain-containing protein [Enterococcus sp. MJM16]MBO0450831.1 hypothetical protein [Enterococcus sp. MJM16]
MTSIVIYATKKGSTGLYAKTFAEKNDYQIFEYTQAPPEELASAEKIFYFGSVYAGNVLGLDELKKKISTSQQITIISVGLTSKNDQEKLAEIHNGIMKIFPEAKMFHLRGRLEKEQLKLPEKLIVKMISKASKKKAAHEKLNIEEAIEKVADIGSVDYINLEELEIIK